MVKIIRTLFRFLLVHPWIVLTITVGLLLLTIFLPKRLRILLLVAYILFIMAMTLLSRRVKTRPINLDISRVLYKLSHNKSSRREVIDNLLLFVPLGAMLCSLKPNLVWLNPIFSIVIELVQYLAGFGTCEISDVVLNSIGGVIGFAFIVFSQKARDFNVTHKERNNT